MHAVKSLTAYTQLPPFGSTKNQHNREVNCSLYLKRLSFSYSTKLTSLAVYMERTWNHTVFQISVHVSRKQFLFYAFYDQIFTLSMVTFHRLDTRRSHGCIPNFSDKSCVIPTASDFVFVTSWKFCPPILAKPIFPHLISPSHAFFTLIIAPWLLYYFSTRENWHRFSSFTAATFVSTLLKTFLKEIFYF